jgi:hypothetical protein
MMKWSTHLLVAILLGVVGCSDAPALKQARVSVSGRVSQGGQPVGNVMVSFHPLDNGHVGSFPVKPDGTFLGELVVGNYSYYVAKSTGPNSDAALRKIDPKYYEPDLGRKVAVQGGQELQIALD